MAKACACLCEHVVSIRQDLHIAKPRQTKHGQNQKHHIGLHFCLCTGMHVSKICQIKSQHCLENKRLFSFSDTENRDNVDMIDRVAEV